MEFYLTFVGNPDEVDDWCFSFGLGHVHPTTGADLFARYVRFPGTTYRAARQRMIDLFGIKWSHQYSTADCAAAVEQYGWIELPEAEWPPVERTETK